MPDGDYRRGAGGNPVQGFRERLRASENVHDGRPHCFDGRGYGLPWAGSKRGTGREAGEETGTETGGEENNSEDRGEKGDG